MQSMCSRRSPAATEVHTMVRRSSRSIQNRSEHHSAATHLVERGELLGQHDRVVLGDQHDPGAQQNPLSNRRRCREPDHRIDAAAVILD